ncbi:hypothetical protein MM236_19110 [Belliella sp. DSM 107340]|uniref:Uncharacterized protein n=1 Tax=Belliella calami TaxID=2923436 RepID=A0ABS9UU11_9BACT|nr:hypothetical protein [Belliella calami]MCH7400113.1 hypothetical protein [Belliella calami]
MDIDGIYLKVCDLIAEVPEVKWIDMDFGQLDDFNTRPMVAFPCALIGIDIINAIELGQKKQKCQVLVNVKLAFDYKGESAHLAPENVKDRSLAYYAVVKNVYKKLQGQRVGTTPLKRQRQIETARPDRIKICELPFSTEFLDVSAAE